MCNKIQMKNPESFDFSIPNDDRLILRYDDALKKYNRLMQFIDKYDIVASDISQSYRLLFEQGVGVIEKPIENKLNTNLIRPSIEPVIISSLKKDVSELINQRSLLSVSQSLETSPISVRNKVMYGSGDVPVVFSNSLSVEQLCTVINCILEKDICIYYKAASIFGIMIICHPFSDANGRLARLIFNYVLMQSALVKMPLYAINSCFYVNMRDIGSAIIRCNEEHSWYPIYEALVIIIETSVEFAQKNYFVRNRIVIN